ncbi:7-carboxy-7-deazaguanine synthase QueE [Fluviispira vulneris]|uniref:7-carboxy-7-deazaguanine synthase QueE n=1 Tax=Fluviispira vulneris TaxID=2763012 RepID=UPI0016459EA1|nr:7-carboxy-7-deazaguanine synthase QueE [Fluviispira vulneris]
MSFLVNEIYPCLQGEGVNTGVPSLLVRFHICNLRCTWCDTPYTHTFKSDPIDKNNPNGKQKFVRLSLPELVKRIKEFPQKHLILSGGEPTLHNLGLLMRTLGEEYSAEVESNGTRIPHKQIPNFLITDYNLMQWNISPKFSNAGEDLVPEALTHWAELSKNYDSVHFKFVVRKDYLSADMQEIMNIINQQKISAKKVLLMPEGTTIQSQIENIWLHDECLKHGFRYAPRLHVLLFGNLRGV